MHREPSAYFPFDNTLASLRSLLTLDRPQDQAVALIGNGVRTWADFLQDVKAGVAFLKAQKQRRWAVHYLDAYQFAVALFSLWQAGCSIVLLPNAQPDTRNLLAYAFDGFLSDHVVDACSLPANHVGSEPLVESDWGSAASLTLFTSGSGGTPKRVDKTLVQLDAELSTLEGCFGPLMGDSVVLSTVSHQHIFGLLFRVLWPLLAGRAFSNVTQAYPESLFYEIQQHTRAVLVSSPAFLRRVVLDQHRPALSSGPVALFASGGPLERADSLASQQIFKAEVTEVFGSTETGGVAWRRQSAAGSVAWQALPGVEIGCEEGLLSIRSPHLPDKTRWRMADRIRLLDAAPGGIARFEHLGRSDRVVKIEEKRISLDEVEARLRQSPLLDDVAVSSLPRTTLRQCLGALLVPSESGWALHQREGERAFKQQLREHLLARFEAVVIPRQLRVLTGLPRNAQGKLSLEAQQRCFERPTEPLVRVMEQTADGVCLALYVPADLFYLDGHFPGNPVLPGVVQIDWAIRLAGQHLPLAGVFEMMENIKFRQIARPKSWLHLQLRLSNNGSRLSFEYASERGVHSSGRIRFAASADEA